MSCDNSNKIDAKSDNFLQLFSGGRDSFLSACKLLENKTSTVYLISYDNGCHLHSDQVSHGVDRLVDYYKMDRVHYLGLHDISGVRRNFFLPFFNLTPSEIKDKYGEITYSQFNCLICRVSMYLHSIVICQQFDIPCVSDGARRSQGFAIEQDLMLGRFQRLFHDHGIQMVFPVLDITSEWEIKNELLMHGVVPKVFEPQCLLGVPLDKKLSDDTLDGIAAFYDAEILPKSEAIIESIKNTIRVGSHITRWI